MLGCKISRDCEKHNRVDKNVKHVNSICIDDFLTQSYGDLLITGGNAKDRTEAVAHTIVETIMNRPQPVVIFSNSQTLKETLICYAEKGTIGRLFVCDNQYKNYDVFAGMDTEIITNYFSKIAEMYKFNVEQTAAYAYAFLNIVSRSNGKYLDIKTITEYANLSQGELAKDVSELDYQMLFSSVEGAANFKIILANTIQAFRKIYDCSTGFNITTAASDSARTILIQTESLNPNLMRQYFINELSGLLDRHMTIVFDECIFLNDPEFQAFVSSLKDRLNINVVVSVSNNASVINEDFTRNFHRYMVFLGTSNSIQLQRLLTSFGEYTHFEVGNAISTPPTLFPSLVKGRSKSVITYSRAKVRLEEESGNSIVFFGHNKSEILISRYFTFSDTNGGKNSWISKT